MVVTFWSFAAQAAEISIINIQFFPEANEVEFARKSVFEGASFKLDYLTKPSLFEDFGFTTKVKMADRVKPDDEMFLVAYPYFNVNGNSNTTYIPMMLTYIITMSFNVVMSV